MIALVHSAPASMEAYRLPNVGILSSPARFYLDVDGWKWAADNGAFSGFDEGVYLIMLDRLMEVTSPPIFVTVPDIVGDAEGTLRLFDEWVDALASRDFPVAFVGQDGLEAGDDRVPWDEIDAFFIGGSDVWKMGRAAQELVEEARTRGKWVHMGRVNGHQRIRYAKAIGCDSFDGTSMSWFKDRWLREYALHAGDASVQEMIRV